jgi:hypothetical protein
METLSQDDIDVIRTHLQRQHARDPDRFRLAIEAELSRRAGSAKIGRPCKSASLGESAQAIVPHRYAQARSSGVFDVGSFRERGFALSM